VPRLNSNDDAYTLFEWLVDDGQPVEPDEAVAVVETSKATEELVCTGAGELWHLVAAGSPCMAGQVVGRVVPPGTPRPALAAPAEPAAAAGGPLVTGPAAALARELAIDPDRLRGLGGKVVRAADVRRLATAEAAPPVAGGAHALPARQRAVARTVELSHRTIPAAFAAVAVDVGLAQEEARQAGIRLGLAVGLPELLIRAVAPLHARFPLCFAAPLDGTSVRLPDDAHVGVTIDVGAGLLVPVLSHASRLGLDEIAQAVDQLRMAALRDSFRERDLDGGNITVTLHHEPDVVLAIPLVLPGQTCSLALTSPRQELVLDGDGRVTGRTVATVGLAYDHRFVNGRDAVRFLHAVRDRLQEPGSC
jgi:2-oxoglutarate dehydrogenase E2 component (dihydrolipoamide succinyltransferase)